MTGSNSDVRFDVASALQDHQIANIWTETATWPTLNTENLNFSGAFYTRKFEWIEFSTGSYQVKLDCNGGNIWSLSESNNCHLTGTGWNDHIWEIDFSSVLYHPSTGLLSGSAKSFAWDIDLSGIILPLRPVELIISEITASQNAILTVSWAWMYDAWNEWWEWSVLLSLTTSNRSISGTNGTYSRTDLSLAGTYEVTIIDSNGSITTWIPLVIKPDTVSTTLATNIYASTYCGSNNDIGNCPDASTRSATTLTQEPPTGTMVADGVSKYTFTLKPRDQYGNRVTSGSMKIKYITTVKNIQTTIDENFSMYNLTSNYGNGDAFVSNMFPTDITGFWESEKVFDLNSDITYTIASTAPTNDDNEIKLSSIQYINSTINNNLTLWSSVPIFDPPYTATVTSLPPVINQINTFSGVVTGAISGTTPTIISTLQIGDGTKAEWHSLGSIPTATCTNIPSNYSSPISSLCDWSWVSSIATPTGSDFTFTGTYHSIIPNPPQEKTIVKTYIYYTIGTGENEKTVLYNSQSGTLDESVNSTARVTILGGSSAWLGIGGQTRVDIINTLRERIFLLSRNRTDYTTADYLVKNGNYTIPSNIWTTDGGNIPKRTIIVIGGDITISDDISIQDHPLAIIALSGEGNTGGNIIIKDWVKDIHATLIAEHAIISTPTTNQLYIHGSLISANPPRDLAPSFCPFFVSGTCDPSDYDLPGKRWITTKSVGWTSYNTPLVIESDPRLLSDPPPAMKK
jgi:hypothetical protein